MKLSILLAVFSVVAGVSATDILYQDDFESSIPGKAPKGWKNLWGKPGNDTFTVSSEKSVSGDNSLQFKRTDNDNIWQSFLHLPKFKDGNIEISFNFLLLGKPGDTNYRLVYRKVVSDPQPEIDLRLTLNGVSGQIAKNRFKLEEVAIAPDQWYNLSLKFPTAAEDGKEILITLTDVAAKKEQKCTIPWRNDKTESGVLIWEFPGKPKDTSLFLDDFKIANTQD